MTAMRVPPSAQAAMRAAMPNAQMELFGRLGKFRFLDHLRIGQVAKVLAMSPQSVYQLFDLGELDGFSAPITGEEKQKRVAVESLCRFLAKNGTYSDEEMAEVYAVFVEKLGPRWLQTLKALVDHRIERLRKEAR